MFITVVLLVFGILKNSLGDNPKSGPFNMKVFNFSDCGERAPGQMVFDFQFENINDTTGVLEGLLQVPKGVGDDMSVSIEVSRWNESSFSDKAYSLKLNKLCSGMKKIMKETFTQVTQYLEMEDKCPIIAGNYEFKNFLLSLKVNIVKEAVYGLYKSRLEAKKDDVLAGCVETIFSATPK